MQREQSLELVLTYRICIYSINHKQEAQGMSMATTLDENLGSAATGSAGGISVDPLGILWE